MDKKKRNEISKYVIKNKTASISFAVFRTLLIIGLSAIILFPIISALIPAITDFNYLGEPNSVWIPLKTSGLAFGVASGLLNYKKTLIVTLLYSGSIALLQVGISAWVGYGFATMRSKFKNVLFFLVILTIIVPVQALSIPQGLYFKKLGIIDNIMSLYLITFFCMGLKSGLFIYLFKQYFQGLPKELEEAAAIDGCGYTKTFFKIMLPNAVPVMLTVFVFSFVWNFSDVYYASWFAKSSPLLSIAIQDNVMVEAKIKGQFVAKTLLDPTDMPSLFVGSVIGATEILFLGPMILFYMIIQRKFVQGFERSGLTGQ